MIVRQGLVLAGVGVLVGIFFALLVTQAMSGLLYGISPRDPLTLIFTAAILLLVSACAAYIPARRATRVDPMVALRYE